MQYIAIVIFIWFLIKSISFSIYEMNKNNNKFGGIFCLALSIISFIAAIAGLVMFYGQTFIGDMIVS